MGDTIVRSTAQGRCDRGGMLRRRSAGRDLPCMVTSRCAVCGGRRENRLSRSALWRWWNWGLCRQERVWSP
mgnify:CR=1 FL=1